MSKDDGGQDDRTLASAETVQLVLKETKDLIRALEGTATTRVTIRTGAVQIEVERGGLDVADPSATTPPGATAGRASSPAMAPGTVAIVAPLVGVFYRAPSPGAPPFVEAGDLVEPGQTVAIVEAMKMMNKVTSDLRGVVASVLVEDGKPVHFEQPLMLIDTSTTGAP
jgi:acetyl-CoA carboxylase biotin carboxyl carrier protein